MAFPWPGKKDVSPGTKPEFPPAREADFPNGALAECEIPLRRDSLEGGDDAGGAPARSIESTAQRLEHDGGQDFGQKLEALAGKVDQYFNALPQYFTAIQQQIMAVQQQVGADVQTIMDTLRAPHVEEPSEQADSGDWQEALLGGELANNPVLKSETNRLLAGVHSGEPAACGLVGSLLQFRAAAADKMPPLLKDVGEAFYRWQPKTFSRPSEMEKAMADWLVRACDQAGMANTIELVNLGERFDSLRHHASRPGVEITHVLGWIVLRDNGKVYTRASVIVK